MRLSRISKAAKSPNPEPKTRRRLFQTAKDSYLFKTAKEQFGFGLWPLPGHIQAVVQFPFHVTCLELQHFLGLLNFYRCFLRDAAGFLLPFTDVLQGSWHVSALVSSCAPGFQRLQVSLGRHCQARAPSVLLPN